MALVIAGMATFLYLRLGGALNASVNHGLQASANNVVALVRAPNGTLPERAPRQPLADADESFGQILDAQGTIVDATPLVAATPLLSEPQLARARERAVLIDGVTVPGHDEPFRLLATPVTVRDQQLVVVVGSSTDERADALDGLRTQLLIGGPIALLLASIAGYFLSGAALRPVESMRQRAAEISATTAGQRLPVPTAQDEISRLGTTLNDMLERLESALARERRFVADASHELRTPLALLRTELELAVRRTRTPEELEAAVRSAAEETERLSQLAEDLLVLARADQGALHLRSSPLPVRELLDRVAERFRAPALETGRAIAADGDLDVTVEGDPLLLEQALANLVVNALRHGGGPIRLEGRRDGELVELHVTDEGQGFSESFLPFAFERFSRSDEARSRGGTGLGLAIVDVIARAHGGSAGAANTAQGADVWISLPVAA